MPIKPNDTSKDRMNRMLKKGNRKNRVAEEMVIDTSPGKGMESFTRESIKKISTNPRRSDLSGNYNYSSVSMKSKKPESIDAFMKRRNSETR